MWVDERESGERKCLSREVNRSLGRLGRRKGYRRWLAAAESKEEISRTLFPSKPPSHFQTDIVFLVSGSLFLLW